MSLGKVQQKHVHHVRQLGPATVPVDLYQDALVEFERFSNMPNEELEASSRTGYSPGRLQVSSMRAIFTLKRCSAH